MRSGRRRKRRRRRDPTPTGGHLLNDKGARVELLRGHVFVGMVGGGWTNEVDFAFLSFCIQGV